MREGSHHEINMFFLMGVIFQNESIKIILSKMKFIPAMQFRPLK
jgi:hypothetical protein